MSRSTRTSDSVPEEQKHYIGVDKPVVEWYMPELPDNRFYEGDNQPDSPLEADMEDINSKE